MNSEEELLRATEENKVFSDASGSQRLLADFMYYVKRKRQAEKRGDISSAKYWYSLQLQTDMKMRKTE